MLLEYVDLAMRKAHYEILADDGKYYGEIACCPGVYSTAETLEACRSELREVLEEWILVRVSRGLRLPTIDGVRLAVKKVA